MGTVTVVGFSKFQAPGASQWDVEFPARFTARPTLTFAAEAEVPCSCRCLVDKWMKDMTSDGDVTYVGARLIGTAGGPLQTVTIHYNFEGNT